MLVPGEKMLNNPLFHVARLEMKLGIVLKIVGNSSPVFYHHNTRLVIGRSLAHQ